MLQLQLCSWCTGFAYSTQKTLMLKMHHREKKRFTIQTFSVRKLKASQGNRDRVSTQLLFFLNFKLLVNTRIKQKLFIAAFLHILIRPCSSWGLFFFYSNLEIFYLLLRQFLQHTYFVSMVSILNMIAHLGYSSSGKKKKLVVLHANHLCGSHTAGRGTNQSKRGTWEINKKRAHILLRNRARNMKNIDESFPMPLLDSAQLSWTWWENLFVQ